MAKPQATAGNLSSSSPPAMIWDLEGEQPSWVALHGVLLVLATVRCELITGRSESQGLYTNDST